MSNIRTSVFKVSSAHICRTMLMLYGRPWIIGAAILVIPMVGLGIFLDIRWLILAMMTVFLVIPMATAFLFFYYGLNRISVLNSISHDLEFSDSGIKASLFDKIPDHNRPDGESDKPDGDSDRPDGDSDKPDGDSDNSGEDTNEYKLRSQTDIPYSSVRSFSAGISDAILYTDFQGKGFLIIPLSSFSGSDQFTKAIEIVAKSMGRK